MLLDNAFAVHAPIDRVWATLMNVDEVAGCVPGAQVLGQLAEDSYQVGMRVKLGPISMQYRGQLEILERDEAARRATMRGKAKETRGQGTAEARVEMQLTEDGGLTRGTVHADVRLSGRAAAMGQGVISDVAAAMLGQFADNLETMLNRPDAAAGSADHGAPTAEPADHARSGETVVEGVQTLAAGSQHAGVITPPEDAKPGTAPVEQVGGDPAMTQGQVVTGPGTAADTVDVPSAPVPEANVSGGAQSIQGGRISDRVAASGRPPGRTRPAGKAEDAGADDAGADDAAASLDVLDLVGAVARRRLGEARVRAALLGLGALLMFALGRRSGRRGARVGYGCRIEDLERFARLLARERDAG